MTHKLNFFEDFMLSGIAAGVSKVRNTGLGPVSNAVWFRLLLLQLSV